jgi:hypothetical protein
MGYTTNFRGKFELNKPLDKETLDFLQKLNKTRRMARKLPQQYGVEGEFYVDGGGDFGQAREPSIIDYNRPPKTQPGLWCQWRPSDDGTCIEWDGGEKFYRYVEWLQYIIKNFLAPKRYVLNGEVEWRGESWSDSGVIVAKDNAITIKRATFIEEPAPAETP